VQLLLDTDAAIYLKDAADADLSIVTALIDTSADIRKAVLSSLVTRQYGFNDYSIYHDIQQYCWGSAQAISVADEIHRIGFVDINKYDEDGLTPLMQSCCRGKFRWAKFFLERGGDPEKHHRDYELVAAHCFYGFVGGSDLHLEGIAQLGRIWQKTSLLSYADCRCSLKGHSGLTSFLMARSGRNVELTTYDRQRRFRTLLESNWIPVDELPKYYRAFARIEIFQRLEMTHTCPQIDSIGSSCCKITKISLEDAIEIEDEELELANYLEECMRQYDEDLDQYSGTLEEFYFDFMCWLDECDLEVAPEVKAVRDEEQHDIMGPGEPEAPVKLRDRKGEYRMGVKYRPYHCWGHKTGTLERYLCNHREYVGEENMLSLLFGEE